jgi:hypothetical protein
MWWWWIQWPSSGSQEPPTRGVLAHAPALPGPSCVAHTQTNRSFYLAPKIEDEDNMEGEGEA